MTGRLADPILWISASRVTSDGRACRLITTFAEDGAPLLEALAFPWRREIVARAVGPEGRTMLVMRRRRSFPFTGKVDIENGSAAGRLGGVTRAGRVLDADGRLVGRFTDTRSLKRRTAESLAEGLGNALLGLESVGAPAAADSFVLAHDGLTLGSLVRAPLPFDLSDREGPHRSGIGRLIPERWRAALSRRFAPRGWRFARVNCPGNTEPMLLLGAALFTVELTHW